jgi:hypothetical protein
MVGYDEAAVYPAPSSPHMAIPQLVSKAPCNQIRAAPVTTDSADERVLRRHTYSLSCIPPTVAAKVKFSVAMRIGRAYRSLA